MAQDSNSKASELRAGQVDAVDTSESIFTPPPNKKPVYNFTTGEFQKLEVGGYEILNKEESSYEITGDRTSAGYPYALGNEGDNTYHYGLDFDNSYVRMDSTVIGDGPLSSDSDAVLQTEEHGYQSANERHGFEYTWGNSIEFGDF